MMPAGQTYAIKVMNLRWLVSKNLHRRVRSEISIHKSLNHKHIVPLLTTFKDSKYIYLVLAHASHGNLYTRLRHNYRHNTLFSKRKLQELFREVVEAVDYLHCRNIVHRDLKLSNILLDGEEKVLLCDFGLAKKVCTSIDAVHVLCFGDWTSSV